METPAIQDMDSLYWLAIGAMVCGLFGFVFMSYQNQAVFTTLGELDFWPDEQTVWFYAQVLRVKRFNGHAQVQLSDGNTVWAQSPLELVENIPDSKPWFECKARVTHANGRFKLHLLEAKPID